VQNDSINEIILLTVNEFIRRHSGKFELTDEQISDIFGHIDYWGDLDGADYWQEIRELKGKLDLAPEEIYGWYEDYPLLKKRIIAEMFARLTDDFLLDNLKENFIEEDDKD